MAINLSCPVSHKVSSWVYDTLATGYVRDNSGTLSLRRTIVE
jgi:hypothetical protein